VLLCSCAGSPIHGGRNAESKIPLNGINFGEDENAISCSSAVEGARDSSRHRLQVWNTIVIQVQVNKLRTCPRGTKLSKERKER
jgi:hypothetical protein